MLAILLSGMVTAEIAISPTAFEFDYAELGEDDKRLDFDETITLTNNGNSTESVTLSLTTLDSNFRDLALSSSSFSLSAGAIQTVTLSGEAPTDLDYDYNEDFVKLMITASTTKEVAFKASAKPMIEMDKIYVYVNGNQEDDYQDGDTIDALNPGDQVELRFILSNRYDNNYEKGDISGTINVDLDDIDLGEEEIDFDLTAGDEFGQSDAPRINFTIPVDMDEDDYSLDITFDNVESGSGAEFELEDWTLTLTVEKESDMVRLSNLVISPSEVSCSRRVEISGTLTNTGNDNQRYADVTIVSPELGMDKRFDYSLNEGKSQTFSYFADLNTSLKADIYPIRVTGYVDSTKPKDGQILELVVKDCASSKPAVPTNTAQNTSSSTVIKNTTGNVVSTSTNDKTSTAAPVSSSNIVKTVEKSYTKDDYLAGIMLTGLVLAVILIVVFAIILLK